MAGSGELQIVFIYDTQRCKDERDSPLDAILYFYPDDIPEDRRLAIVGQLMGVAFFLTEFASFPKCIFLENGKFALKSIDKRFILALGCSSVTPDQIIEKQSNVLHSLLRLFHSDLQTIVDECKGDRFQLIDKIGNIMENHCIPLSQRNGDLTALAFGILPILSLPKSASNIVLSASILLQSCILQERVIGGLVMYQDKIVGAELSPDLAQKLALIQPYHIPPGNPVPMSFKLPPGVQLIQIFLTPRDLKVLKKGSTSIVQKQSVTNHPVFQPGKNPNSSAKGIARISSQIDTIREGEEFIIESLSSIQINAQKSNSLLSENRFESFLSSDGFFPLRGIRDSNLKQLQRQFKSQEIINYKLFSSIEELNQPLARKNSIGDPTFPLGESPFLQFGGKCISQCLIKSSSEPPTPAASPAKEIKSKNQEIPIQNSHPKPHSSRSTSFQFEIRQKSIPEAQNIPESDGGMRRPVNLPLNLEHSSTQRLKNRRWTTFEDMLSPVASSPLFESPGRKFSQEPDRKLDINSNNPKGGQKILMESFRKLPSGVFSSKSGISTTSSSSDDDEERKLSHLTLKNRKSALNGGKDQDKSDIRSVLFIYSIGCMRLILILHDDHPEPVYPQEFIEHLWEFGSSSLQEIEESLGTVEESSLEDEGTEAYCFLSYEDVWKSLKVGGRNHQMDLDVVQLMKRCFERWGGISEIIVRRDDHVVYGNESEGSQVFYQQTAPSKSGLPLPTDLMGKIPLKAKRRLERNHNILIL